MKHFSLFFLACFALGVRAPAHAEQSSTRTAFAVVIGNNLSLSGHRPDLHYADDDAAKYAEILETIAPSRVTLLTTADADTQRLFPSVISHASAPTKAAVTRVGRELAAAVKSENERGQQTEVYFVFAGHGDVDEGAGYLELADTRFWARDLEAWLRAIPFTHAHVILDSCNSFFMLGTRKPGGRYYATSEDAVRALSTRLSNVGVFLSTSADGDAFEWSEIQSGVFSHLVRSGLLGAADANADGQVEYVELAAFVATATADVVNPNMRPHVFARGPGGRDDLPIVARDRSGVRALQLHEPHAMRLRLRDPNAIPLLDANTEPQSPYLLQLPKSWARGAVLERAAPSGSRVPPEQLILPSQPETLSLAALEGAAARGSSVRGPADIFDKLFKTPFGLQALARYRQQLKSAAPAVFGVSRETAERMGLLLDQIASAERDQRVVAAISSFGLAGVYGLYGGSMLAFNHRLPSLHSGDANLIGGLMLGLGAAAVGAGIYRAFSLSDGEQLALDYRAAVAANGDYARAFALANDSLRTIASAQSRQRWLGGVGGGLLLASSGLVLAVHELEAHSLEARLNVRALTGAGMLLGLSLLCRALLMESPIQRLLTIWNDDNRRLQLQPVVAPMQGGAYLGVQGRF